MKHFEKRKTGPIMDKILVFVYGYQQTHCGKTPSRPEIAKHIGSTTQNGMDYVRKLVSAGRVVMLNQYRCSLRLQVRTGHTANRLLIRDWNSDHPVEVTTEQLRLELGSAVDTLNLTADMEACVAVEQVYPDAPSVAPVYRTAREFPQMELTHEMVERGYVVSKGSRRD